MPFPLILLIPAGLVLGKMLGAFDKTEEELRREQLERECERERERDSFNYDDDDPIGGWSQD